MPLLLHAAIYLELSLRRETSHNAFSRETALCKLEVCANVTVCSAAWVTNVMYF